MKRHHGENKLKFGDVQENTIKGSVLFVSIIAKWW
jgi:hypothetical protein